MIRLVVLAVAFAGPAMAQADFSYGTGVGAYGPGTPSYGATTPRYGAPGYTTPSYGAPPVGVPGYGTPVSPSGPSSGTMSGVAAPGSGGSAYGSPAAKAAPERIPVRRRGVIVPGQFVDAPAPRPYDPLMPPGVSNTPPAGIDRFLPPR